MISWTLSSRITARPLTQYLSQEYIHQSVEAHLSLRKPAGKGLASMCTAGEFLAQCLTSQWLEATSVPGHLGFL